MNDISELIEAEKQFQDQQQQLIEIAHQAGMAEIAINIMHNIGNILNSVNISSEHFFSILKKSKVNGFVQGSKLLHDNLENLKFFLDKDKKGQVLPEYLINVIQGIEKDNQELKAEGIRLVEKIKQIGEAIELQQVQAKTTSFKEPIKLVSLVEEVLRILNDDFLKNSVAITKEILVDDLCTIKVSKSKLFNVLLNIIKNAYESVLNNTVDNRKIKIGIFYPEPLTVQINIADNGVGISKEEQSKIFKFGYTTKEQHSGFGLHYCNIAVAEMEGSIAVKSEGIQKGAVFSILLPEEN